MWNTVECPYCEYKNDMSDALTDLPSDNMFDHECANCEQEFEVEVEFDPQYSANKIIYEKCQICSDETRDICQKGKIFPYPEHVKEAKLCWSCFSKEMARQYEMEDA